MNNLLSEGIVNLAGSPGLNFAKAHQFSANVMGSATFQLSPTTGKTLYATLPAPLNGGPTNVCVNNGVCTHHDATTSENGLSSSPIDYYQFMLASSSECCAPERYGT